MFEQTEVQQQWPAHQELDYAAKPLRCIMFIEGEVPLVCFKGKKLTFLRSIASRTWHVQGRGCVLEAFFTKFLKTAELVCKHLSASHILVSPPADTAMCSGGMRGDKTHWIAAYWSRMELPNGAGLGWEPAQSTGIHASPPKHFQTSAGPPVSERISVLLAGAKLFLKYFSAVMGPPQREAESKRREEGSN